MPIVRTLDVFTLAGLVVCFGVVVAASMWYVVLLQVVSKSGEFFKARERGLLQDVGLQDI